MVTMTVIITRFDKTVMTVPYSLRVATLQDAVSNNDFTLFAGLDYPRVTRCEASSNEYLSLLLIRLQEPEHIHVSLWLPLPVRNIIKYPTSVTVAFAQQLFCSSPAYCSPEVVLRSSRFICCYCRQAVDHSCCTESSYSSTYALLLHCNLIILVDKNWWYYCRLISTLPALTCYAVKRVITVYIVMGTGIAEGSKKRPFWPRSSWDARSAPWTDGIGGQPSYAEWVSDWSTFHDNFEDNNSDKLSKRIVELFWY